MNIDAFSPLLIFLGTFTAFQFFLPFTLMPFLKSLLNGPLARLSANYFKDFAKEKFDEAYRQNEPDRAWEEIALAKIREMGHSRTPYEKRKQSLIYINKMVPTKRIAAGLIDILPEQHKLDFQQELACFICKTLENLGLEGKGNNIKVGVIKNTLTAPLQAWSDLFSAWLSSCALLFFVWSRLDDFPLVTLLLLCILFLGFTCYPILKVNIKLSSVVAYISFSIFSVLSVLALYANINHSGTNSVTLDLSNIGYNGTVLTVIHPKWASYDNSNTCGDLIPISVLVEQGTLPIPMRFDFDNKLFSARNGECKAIAPLFDFSSSNEQSVQFYLLPLDVNTLGEKNISLTPVLVFPDKEIFLSNNVLVIRTEPAFWRIVHQVYFFLLGGTASFSFILAQVISSLRRKDN